MNAIRSLPLINRPSRTSTPAPSATVTGSAAVQPLGPPPVPAVTERARSAHPLAQTVHAPAPVAALATPRSQSAGPVGPARKGASSPPTRSQTPRSGTAPVSGTGAETPQGGGYMDVISLRLNETVNKACAGVDAKTRRGFRKGAGWTVGESIASELPALSADTYLLRAILRTVVRVLSIYASRLDALLLPALSDPLFHAPLNLTPGTHTSPLNATQAFAVTVAQTAWETCERLEQMVETGQYPRFVEDTLRPTMDKFDLVVGKVVRPILLALKIELEGSLNKTNGVAPRAPAGPATVPVPASPAAVPLSREKSKEGARLTKEPSGGGHPRQIAVPACLQQFASRVDGARKAFELIAGPCGHDGEGWVAKVVVATVWRGMRIITENDTSVPNRTPSPGSVHRALSGIGKEPTPTVVAAPPALSKITSSLTLLPSRGASRPPSPPRGSKYDATTHALMSFEGLVKRLVGGLVQPPTAAPSAADSADQEAEYIAREALHEALEALESAITCSAVLHADSGSVNMLGSVRRLRDDIDVEEHAKLDDALEDLPSVYLFGVIRRRANGVLAILPAVDEKDVAPLRLRDAFEVMGCTQAEYERQVLSGFGPAEEHGPRVARALKPEVERVLAALATVSAAQGDKAAKDTVEAAEWVRALGVALDARTGVKVARCA